MLVGCLDGIAIPGNQDALPAPSVSASWSLTNFLRASHNKKGQETYSKEKYIKPSHGTAF